MKSTWLLPVAAVIGLAIAVYAVIDTNRAPPALAAPATTIAPFASYVVGTGIAETGRGNVEIGTALFGVVIELYVKVGDTVKAGDPLFRIDDRELQARLVVARAKADQAAAARAKPQHRLQMLAHLKREDASAVSVAAISDLRDDANAARSTQREAQAEAAQIQVDIERSLVRAPTAGRVLQVNTRTGQYAQGGGQSKPLLLLGDDSRLYLRVDIDENDAWRVHPQAPARAFVRGNPQLQSPLRFEYIEPVVAPKTALTGQGTERSDVRALQVLYSFERGALPVYLGQQMDVYIQAPPVPEPATAKAR